MGAGYQKASSIPYFEPSLITGVEGLTYGLDWYWYVYGFEPFDFNVRIYDITGDALVAGTLNNLTGDGFGMGYLEDTPTMPVGAGELVAECDDAAITKLCPGWLLCYQTENLPAGPSYPADPTQPSGYHCFMSQYLRNVIDNRAPLETPDGVNKLW